MNKQQLVLVLIRNQYEELTRAEKRIANYLLENASQVPHMNVSELAEAANVAGSAVIRFSKTLGFKGYAELKINLAYEIANATEPLLLPIMAREDPPEEIIQKVFQSNIKALKDTAQMLDSVVLKQALALLRCANHILFFGVGTSSGVAQDGQLRLMQIGYPASCATDVLYMRVAAVNLRPGDVAVGIAHSGKTRDTIETLEIAKKAGASTIAITSYRDSPICEYADIALTVYSDELPRLNDSAVMPVRAAHICLIDAISMALAFMDYDRSLSKIRQRNAIIETMRK